MYQPVAAGGGGGGGVKMQLSQMRGGVDKIPQQVEDEPGVMIGTPLFRE